MQLHDVSQGIHKRKRRKRIGRGVGSGCGNGNGSGNGDSVGDGFAELDPAALGDAAADGLGDAEAGTTTVGSAANAAAAPGNAPVA